jgi:hypothetical protein
MSDSGYLKIDKRDIGRVARDGHNRVVTAPGAVPPERAIAGRRRRALLAAVVAPDRDQSRHRESVGMFVSQRFAPNRQDVARIPHSTKAVTGGSTRRGKRQQRCQG